jgi:AcrR family transcriptional regulator
MSVDKKFLPFARGERVSSAPAPASPLYKRLPHGPHRLGREDVVHNQRIRIHGAMVEAVAASGYAGTSVKQVIALAGVSRRSFYEQFANKEECLLATFDLLAGNAVRRAGEAYLASGGRLEERLRAALAEFAQPIMRNRKAAGLVIVETPTAGVPGLMRLRQATARCERMLFQSFSGAPEASTLPVPVVRAIAGGLYGAMSVCVRERQSMKVTELTEEMLAWTLRFQTPAVPRMAELITVRVARSLAAGPVRPAREPLPPGSPRPRGGGPAIAASGDGRTRLMESALRLVAVEDLRELTAPRIAEEATVTIDEFFEVFEDKDECFLAALDMLAEQLIQTTADDGLLSADWPRAVRRAVASLMLYLAERPHYARTIAADSFLAGPDAARRNVELAQALAGLLTEGAPGEPPGRLTLEGVGGAIWHTVRCQVACGRIHLLPVLSDYLSYVVLAPFIGAEAAVEVMSEELPG